MCGISGIISHSENIKEPLLKAQLLQLHRGPDSQGIHCSKINQWNIGLGHQRLSILDLTDLASQPMFSPGNRSCIIYNGEIYNYLEIRKELEALGHKFKTTSDTEVLLTALEEWGIDKALSKFNGMWAFAWLDQVNRRLVLARDRLGIKPLYFSWVDDCLYFASEIKSILSVANHKFQLNYQVIGEYLLQSLLETSGKTFFNGIEKVPSASYITIDLSGKSLSLDVKYYWDLQAQLMENNFSDVLSIEQIIEQIKALFFDSVRLRLRSDVPVGVLLSGGVDSSSIATAMQILLGKDANLNLLASVSEDPRYDESPFIDIMGRHLNLPVHKVNLSFPPEQAINYVERVNWFNDEPIANFSNVAHYLLMSKAKEMGITVILSGQGADELLCGYKKFLGFYIQTLIYTRNYYRAAKSLFSFWQNGTIISQFSFNEAKRYLPRFFRNNQLNIAGNALKDFNYQFVGIQPEQGLMMRQIQDLTKYSVPTLLHYEDRMSMAWSREIRVPFLDYRLVENIMSLPDEMKLNYGWTKWIFRKVMEPYLPREIVWRKDKQGFVNPQSEWLKYNLKEQVMEYFNDRHSLIFEKSLVNQQNILRSYHDFCKNKNSGVSYKDIFAPLSLEIWLRQFESYIQ